MGFIVSESCCGGGSYDEDDVDGECPYCGAPMIDDQAAEQCSGSECHCDYCGDSPCDGGC